MPSASWPEEACRCSAGRGPIVAALELVASGCFQSHQGKSVGRLFTGGQEIRRKTNNFFPDLLSSCDRKPREWPRSPVQAAISREPGGWHTPCNSSLTEGL